MFDSTVAQQVVDRVEALSTVDLTCASTDELGALLRQVQTSLDVLTSITSRAGAAFAALEGPERSGCVGLPVWLRRELRLSPAEIRSRELAAVALEGLDQVRAAAASGEVRPEHVREFGAGCRKVGEPVMARAQQVLLPVARDCDPSVLREAIDHLHATVHPDAADADWATAQEKQNLTCRRVGYGFDVRGFLDADTGTLLATVLGSWSRPTEASTADTDDRPVARRRVEGLRDLLASYVAAGLPSDKGIRPHLNITVDLQTLQHAFSGDRRTPSIAPTLAGYGVVGRDLLARLGCDASVSTLLTDGTTDQHRCSRPRPATGAPDGPGTETSDPVRHGCGCTVVPFVHVLDAGRSERIATPRQRLAVLTAQQHRCATPGCNNQHLEVHHIVPWLLGGATDMDNLVGLCSACHTLVHRGLLVCTSDGHGGAAFARTDGARIDDVRRRTMAAYAREVRDCVSATLLEQQQVRNRLRPPPEAGCRDPASTPPF